MYLKKMKTHNKMSKPSETSVKRQENGLNLHVNGLKATKIFSLLARLLSPSPKGLRALCGFTTVNHQRRRVCSLKPKVHEG